MSLTHCKYCAKPLSGRTDKKFCDSYCKNAYHHQRNKQETHTTHQIDRLLHRNRKILSRVIQNSDKQKVFVSKKRLIKEGFLFEYCTGIFINKEGKMYKYLYDFAWMEFKNEQIMVIQNSRVH